MLIDKLSAFSGVSLMALGALVAGEARAVPGDAAEFASIDGGTVSLHDWAGRPILVVNTASRCGFTSQYKGLQTLHERYGEQGLLVLAVPSNDFRQELSSDAEVAEFCELNYNITLPMTTITPVRGAQAHPFYKWVAQSAGFAPRWNFSKVLVGPDGEVVETFGSAVKPLSARITAPIDDMLAKDDGAGG